VRFNVSADDQIVPIADSALLCPKVVKGAALKVIPGGPWHVLDLEEPDQRGIAGVFTRVSSLRTRITVSKTFVATFAKS
jgi:hypothetical protein